LGESAPVGAGAYAEVAYPGYAYPATHPARLEVLARLFGLTPAKAESCRVLELGCGDGANALAIAQTLPGAEVIGIDAAASAIERGTQIAREARLSNVDLRVGDLADLGRLELLAPVDYIVAHGVYSWIPPHLRGALLECCRRCLAPHGIAFVSYNAYPGSYLRDMARDILQFHLRGVTAPSERLTRARDLMETIAAVEDPSPYARVLRDHLQRMLPASDALLYHDDLAAVSTPFYFHEFMEHAEAHGLQFLSEADLSDSQMRDVPERVGELIASLPADVVAREQYLDFLNNRMFRQTLLARRSAPVRRAIDDETLGDLLIASPAKAEDGRFVTSHGVSITTSDPLVAAVMRELADCWPAALAFDELAARAGRQLSSPLQTREQERLRGILLDAYLARLVELRSCALPVVPRPSRLVTASPLARAQAAAGVTVVSTLTSGNYILDEEMERTILRLLDGTRDRHVLARELGTSHDAVQELLLVLAQAGLLCS
jgi:SAM-dependent methyltransferase